jgi:hypothetical protein
MAAAFRLQKAIVLLLHTFAQQRFNVAMAIQPWKMPIRLGLRMAHVRTHGGVIIPQKPLEGCSISFYSALGRKNAPPWLDSALSE